MFAKLSGTDDSSWDIGCCCDCELLLESSVDSADGADGTEPAALVLVVVTVGVPADAVTRPEVGAGVPGIGC